jgi:carbon-monoxide dehydrogenase medium subunit
MYTMRPAPFAYHRPTSVDEALELLSGNGDTKVLAGGQSLLPAMKLRVASPSTIVDLGKIPGLDGFSKDRDGDTLVIGALTTHAAVASSGEVRSACPVLAETAAQIADVQVRNRGTIGGSLAHADPAADYPTLVTALGATIAVTGKGGSREIPAGEFFTGVFTTALQPGEIITAVRVPIPGGGAAYEKHRHPASRFAVVGVAAVVGMEGGSCTSARLAAGGVTATPVDMDADGLVGSAPSEDAIGAAGEKLRGSIDDALGDTYASAEYRLHLVEVLARRALRKAFERAG